MPNLSARNTVRWGIAGQRWDTGDGLPSVGVVDTRGLGRISAPTSIFWITLS
jgi:hypothetical protein